MHLVNYDLNGIENQFSYLKTVGNVVSLPMNYSGMHWYLLVFQDIYAYKMPIKSRSEHIQGWRNPIKVLFLKPNHAI